MAITRWDAVVDAVVTAVTTQAGSNATVFDGPPVTGEPLDRAIIIGCPMDGGDLAGTIQQEYRTMGGASANRDETGTIRCVSVAQSGEVTVSAARATAVTQVGYVETALRADMDAGVTEALRIELQAGNVRQLATERGTQVSIEFTLFYRAII